MVMVAGGANVAPLTGLTIPTEGNAFNTIATGDETVVELRLSEATAVSTLLPAGAFVQTKSKGGTVLSPNLFVASAKNSTFPTVPSGSFTVTVMARLVGVNKNNWSFAGLVMLTAGG